MLTWTDVGILLALALTFRLGMAFARWVDLR